MGRLPNKHQKNAFLIHFTIRHHKSVCPPICEEPRKGMRQESTDESWILLFAFVHSSSLMAAIGEETQEMLEIWTLCVLSNHYGYVLYMKIHRIILSDLSVRNITQ